MKKNLIVALLAMASVSVLCGFDSAETADSVYEKSVAATREQAGAIADLTMNADASVAISDSSSSSSIDVSANGGFHTEIAMDPMAVAMAGSIDISFMGTNETIEQQTYMVTDEAGNAKSYTYSKDNSSEEGRWAVADASGLNIKDLMESSAKMTLSDIAAWGVTFTLEPEAADVDGTECYVLSTSISTENLGTMISKASELAGQDLASSSEVATALSMMTGIKMDIAYYVDTTSFLPVKTHIDLNESDLSTINSLLNSYMGGAEGTSAELILNDVSMDVATSYGDAPVIEVPAEALEAEANGTAASLNDIASEIAQ